jgi:antitoxin VapB
MSLNIKNKDAHKLAQQLARITGESLTEAVTEAVRERLKRVQNEDKHAAKLSERLLQIGQDCSTRLKEPYHSADHGELLYDEKGLPK